MNIANSSDLLSAIFEVFDAVSTWFVGFVDGITGMFYNSGADGGQLTFFGVLALVGLSISVIFLIIGLISNFLHFRG